MPIVNLNINYENNGSQPDKRLYSLSLIDLAVSQRFSNALGEDERKEYASIFKKIKDAIVANTHDVDFNKEEIAFIRGTFGVYKATLIETIDIFKLEKRIQNAS